MPGDGITCHSCHHVHSGHRMRFPHRASFIPKVFLLSRHLIFKDGERHAQEYARSPRENALAGSACLVFPIWLPDAISGSHQFLVIIYSLACHHEENDGYQWQASGEAETCMCSFDRNPDDIQEEQGKVDIP